MKHASIHSDRRGASPDFSDSRNSGAARRRARVADGFGRCFWCCSHRRPRREPAAPCTSGARRRRIEGRTAITEDDGSFRFTDVPTGQYRVTATRAGFVATAYGASRPGRQGKQIAVTEGADVSGITIKVPRGAVISGVVLDTNGQPLASATVRALRYAMENGERTLVSPHENVTTDDRGEYRLFGLAAGEYVVAASVRSPDGLTTGIQQITNDELTRAKMGLRQMPDSRGAEGAARIAPEHARQRAVKYAAVFYPGTNMVSQAIAVRVGAGEERMGVDIPAQFERVASLSGTLSLASDSALSFVVNLIETGRPFIPGITDIFSPMQADTTGKFLIPNVAPGIYTLAGRPRGAPAPGLRPRSWSAATTCPTSRSCCNRR